MKKDRIVGISGLAQAIMAMGLSQADSARARPSTLLKEDEEYGRIFDPKTPLPVYLWAAKAQKRAEAFLQEPSAASSSEERTNIKFYVSMLAAAKLVGKRVHSPQELEGIAERGRALDDADLPTCLATVRAAMEATVREEGEEAGKVSKGSALVANVLAAAGIT